MTTIRRKKKKGATEDGEKKKYPVFDYCKMKFNMSNTRSKDGKKGKEAAVNLTKLKRQNSDGTTIVTPAKTITQIAEMITFQSEVTIIFYHTRVWAMKTKLNGKRLYGVALKMMFILYTPAANRGVKSDDLDLLPSDDEEEEENAKPAKKPAKPTKSAKPAKPAKSTKKAKLDDDEEEEAAEEPEEEAEEEAEEQEEIPVSKKKKKSKIVEEEDEEAEEEVKPTKKKGKSVSKNRE